MAAGRRTGKGHRLSGQVEAPREGTCIVSHISVAASANESSAWGSGFTLTHNNSATPKLHIAHTSLTGPQKRPFQHAAKSHLAARLALVILTLCIQTATWARSKWGFHRALSLAPW
eukprot:365067-Chlamydomonas_euryale.AAC.20